MNNIINKEEAKQQLKVLKAEVEKLENIISKKPGWEDCISFEACCLFNGERASEKLDKWKYADLTLAQINGNILEYCIKTINQGWKPDPSNKNQEKWFVWYKWDKDLGWVFYCYCYCYCFSHMGFGFYYESEEKAKFGNIYFKQYYDIWLGNNK